MAALGESGHWADQGGMAAPDPKRTFADTTYLLKPAPQNWVCVATGRAEIAALSVRFCTPVASQAPVWLYVLK